MEPPSKLTLAMRAVLAANVKAVVQAKDLGSLEAAAHYIKMKPQQLRRIASGTHSVTLATIALLSEGFDIPAYQLLTPGFDPARPVATMSAQDAEQEIERQARARAAVLLKEAANFYVDPEEIGPDGRSVGKPFGDLQAPHVQQKGSDAAIPAGAKAKRPAKGTG